MKENRSVVKHQRNPYFTQISNSLLESMEISLKAKGLYSYMFSKPENWNFTIKSMAKQLREGTTSISNALIELKDNGWVEYTKYADGTGEYFLLIEPKEVDNRLKDAVDGMNNTLEYIADQQPPKQPTEQKEKKAKYPKQEQEFRDMLERVQSKIKRKTKANFTKKALEIFKQGDLNVDDVERNFILHINQVGQFSKTIANFLLEYEVCVEDLANNNTSSRQSQRNNKPETHIEMRERELAEKIARLQNQDNTNQDIFETEIIGV